MAWSQRRFFVSCSLPYRKAVQESLRTRKQGLQALLLWTAGTSQLQLHQLRQPPLRRCVHSCVGVWLSGWGARRGAANPAYVGQQKTASCTSHGITASAGVFARVGGWGREGGGMRRSYQSCCFEQQESVGCASLRITTSTGACAHARVCTHVRVNFHPTDSVLPQHDAP